MTTMIADLPPKVTRLGVGFDTSRKASQNREAWKQAIGTRPISARLALLPEPQRNWSRIGISAGVQIGVFVFLLMVPLLYPEQMKTALHYTITELAQPVIEIPVAPPPPPPPPKVVKVKTPPPPPVVEPPKLNPQQVHIFMQPKALQPKAKPVEVKPPVMTQVLDPPKVEVNNNQPKRPKEDVKVGNLSTGNATPATVKAPVDQVQTGGFGDPTGLKGKGDPNKGNLVVRQGLPTLPGGPGYGNGTGGDKGVRGTVASTGFGNGTAVPPAGGGKKGNIQSSGFGDATAAAAEAPKKKAANEGPADTPVTILEKPRPEYTAEGRSMKLEGDVVLEVVFLASGKVVVNRVVSGLGHGLDENASRAAQQIRFKPALREGQPVDFPARVRIEFRLAY